jgi:DNA-binding beta-propeller fold protein YncE
VIAGNATGIAKRVFQIAEPPSPAHGFLAVASYDDGIVFHDLHAFTPLGVLATGGAPSDVASGRDGKIVATDTQGSAIPLASLTPWSVRRIEDVPFGDEIAIDDVADAIFVTNRDIQGSGALTRVARDQTVTHVATGQTAEGLAIDSKRRIVYVANVNDGTIAVVDAQSMRVVRHITAVARVFSLVLTPDGSRLYAISNQSTASPFAAPGSAVTIDLDARPPKIVARSGALTFPLGAALDTRRNQLFVTDESLDVVYVLDARTLRPKRPPLQTCRTPWKPTIDPIGERLFVPCARADQIDVFDTKALGRIAGAPFATGSYPLAVTVWRPERAAKTLRR